MEWSFLHDMLIALNFPPHLIKVIMVCLSSTHYSIMLNGKPSDTIYPRRGLRQGDPMSPLLFVIGMEYLSRILMVIGTYKDFRYHPRCRKMQLNHMSFADDLMMFCRGDLVSTQLLCKGLNSFAATSGLCANLSKSSIYLAGIPKEHKLMIAQEVNLPLGSLPFRCLGIPVTSRRISAVDCDSLIDKMTARICSWYARSLSYATRVQLISSVLISIRSYWCIYIIPKAVLRKVNSICRSYLWHGQANNPAPGNIS